MDSYENTVRYLRETWDAERSETGLEPMTDQEVATRLLLWKMHDALEWHLGQMHAVVD